MQSARESLEASFLMAMLNIINHAARDGEPLVNVQIAFIKRAEAQG